ncbi:hypothetical protein ACIRD3_19965 [Kitasatospora sp. NPDC093550]|uniref:hypothetical protein n=1 Tax=Kitasatospora sp. NPDC093550 TaxID=3364089 RepID=UPI0037FB4837
MTDPAVEWPDTRGRLRDPAGGTGHVQLVMRLGYGPPGAPTPRRGGPRPERISGEA